MDDWYETNREKIESLPQGNQCDPECTNLFSYRIEIQDLRSTDFWRRVCEGKIIEADIGRYLRQHKGVRLEIEGSFLNGEEVCEFSVRSQEVSGGWTFELRGVRARRVNFSVDFSIELSFIECSLYGCSFYRAKNCSFFSEDTIFHDCDFSNMENINECILSGSEFLGGTFRKSTFQDSDFDFCDFVDPKRKRGQIDFHRFQALNCSFGNARIRASTHHAKFDGSNFYNASFIKCDMFATSFRGATMRNVRGWQSTRFVDADFTDAKALYGKEFSGIDLTGVRLPETMSRFMSLDQISEISKHARTAFLSLLALCLFSWLLIITGQLIEGRDGPDFDLPFIGIKVPSDSYVVFGSLVTSAIYFYLLLYLQRLWDAMANLPAIFPDGMGLNERAYPWLLSGMTQTHVPWLAHRRPLGWVPQAALSYLLGFVLCPITIFVLWAHVEVTPNPYASRFMGILFFTVTAACVVSIHNMIATLNTPPLVLAERRDRMFNTNNMLIAGAGIAVGFMYAFKSDLAVIATFLAP